MSIFTRLFAKQIEEAVKRELDKVPDWLGQTADSQQWDIPDRVIFANQADLYRLSPILGTALDVLAYDIGVSKFNVKRMVGEEERDIPNHSFEVLLRTPNPLETGMELMQYTVDNYKLNGNAIWWLNRTDKNAEPDEIWSIPYESIQPVPDEKMYLERYDYFPGGGKPPIPLPTWQIVHFKTYNPHNRFWGLSPIESLVTTIQGDLGMRKTQKKTYTEFGGSPRDILAFKNWVNDEAWEEMGREMKRAAIENRTMRLRGVGDTVTWMSRQISNKDMEFVNQLKQNMTDVFNRMCPGLLAKLEPGANRSTADAARATYAEDTEWPMMEVIAQKCTADILPSYGRKLKGEFDDPRVVDRKLELSEQDEFGKVHTVDETRQQYYGDDPLGDERGKLLVVEVKAQGSPFGGSNANPPAQDTTQPAENAPQTDTGRQTVSTKAAIDDLYTWRRMALRGKSDKAQAFVSEHIPAEMMTTIKAELRDASGKDDVAGVFDDAIERLQPKQTIDPAALLEGMRLSLKAIELQKGE